MSVEVVAVYGASRLRVRLIRRDGKLTAEWYERRLRREKSWPNASGNLKLARAWCETFARERLMPTKEATPRLALRELWELYQTANWSLLRPKTQRNYADEWRKWELFAGKHFIAEDITPAMLHSYRRALEQRGLGVHSIRDAVTVCKTVYNWAEREELIGRNRWRLYQLKFAKDALPTSPEEYTAEESASMRAALDPTSAREWRAWVALTILDAQGVRQNAGVQLRWADLDLRRRIVNWPTKTDKVGRGLAQPLRKATVRALRIARNWAKRQGIDSPYVLYSPKRGRQGSAYTPQALWVALRKAETKAGVEHKRFRAAHSLRRKLVGDLAEETGDTLLALRTVGNRDPRTAENYRKDRHEQAASAFRALDRRKGQGSNVAAVSQLGRLGGKNDSATNGKATR